MIKLDIDGRFIRERFVYQVKKLMRVMRFTSAVVRVFRTKKGYHVYISPDKLMTDMEILFCQLYLGSDRERELFNLERIYRGEKEWNVLFILKRYGSKIVSRERYIRTFKISL